jgi:hypothetical protein
LSQDFLVGWLVTDSLSPSASMRRLMKKINAMAQWRGPGQFYKW